MAYTPNSQAYGQISPFRDQAAVRRKRPLTPEEEQQQGGAPAAPEYAPPPRMPQSVPSASSPLSQAIAPQKISLKQQPTQSYEAPQEESALSRAIGGNSGQQQSQYKFSTAPSADGSLDSYRMGSQVQPQFATQDAIGSQPKTQPTQAPSPYATSEPSASPLASAVGGQGYTLSGIGGQGGGQNTFSGFDFGQDAGNRDTGKSLKYAFADLASQSGVAMPTTKQGAEEWFRTYIAPGLQSLGHEVLDVKGDKVLLRNWQGEGWVDFLIGADGANPMLGWQPEGGGGAASDPLAQAVGGQTGDPVQMELAQQMGIDTSNPLWAQILQQLLSEQSMSGQPPQQRSGSAAF